ncbi:MAG: ABC transporter ATP-binding protein [Bacteroidota bacterium]|nr:ABC transporter ATP-binding protein [Bacteroidota bacterium]
MMFFKLNNISKHYGSESEGNLRKVLDGLSLEIKEGESIAILGPSGSGKTTLLNIMGTLDRPDSGEVYFRNDTVYSGKNNIDTHALNPSNQPQPGIISTDQIAASKRDPDQNHAVSKSIFPADVKSELRSVTKHDADSAHSSQKVAQPDAESLFAPEDNLVNFSTQELDTFRNEKIGFVFQMHHLLPQCTLFENILIPTLTIRDKRIRAERLERARELMIRVGIWEQRDQMPGHVSGGESQRAAVVRALINKPALLLADEPTGALDEDNVSKLALLLLEINKTDGVTLVVVTHSVALATRMDTVYELKNGKLRIKDLKA